MTTLVATTAAGWAGIAFGAICGALLILLVLGLAQSAGRAERYVAGTRRGELVAAGLVEKTDRRAPSRKGNPSIVWRCTAAGFDVAARLLDASAGVLGDPRTIRLRENGQVARSRERFRDEVDGARARAGEGAR